MPTMLDDFLRRSFEMPVSALGKGAGDEQGYELYEAIRPLVASAVPIDATPVEQFFASHEREADYWEAYDFPCVAPPFDCLWIEISEGAGHRLARMAWAALVETQRQQETGEFLVRMVIGLRAGSSRLKFPAWRFDYRTDANGVLIEADTLKDLLGLGKSPKWHDLAYTRMLLPILLTFSFMHCKNVTLADAPERRTRQQIRRDERAGVEPVRFKTLDIRPMRKVLEGEGQAATVGLQRAMHICRGHFATYSADKPLFGKHAGTFWVPAHVRGTPERGVIAKDYRVLPA